MRSPHTQDAHPRLDRSQNIIVPRQLRDPASGLSGRGGDAGQAQGTRWGRGKKRLGLSVAACRAPTADRVPCPPPPSLAALLLGCGPGGDSPSGHHSPGGRRGTQSRRGVLWKVLWKLLEALLGQSLCSHSPQGWSASKRTGRPPHSGNVPGGSVFPPVPFLQPADHAGSS